jgi:hypothetical protein
MALEEDVPETRPKVVKSRPRKLREEVDEVLPEVRHPKKSVVLSPERVVRARYRVPHALVFALD